MRNVRNVIENMNVDFRFYSQAGPDRFSFYPLWDIYNKEFSGITPENVFFLGRSLGPFIPGGSHRFNWSQQ